MARNTMRLDTSAITSALSRLEGLGGNVEATVERLLKNSAMKIQVDTVKALAKPNLPAGGKYWTGTTKQSIIKDLNVQWEGQVAWIPIGFDFNEAGAGGYLITGTPKMSPDYELRKMYRQKKYMNEIQTQMSDVVWNEILNLESKK